MRYWLSSALLIAISLCAGPAPADDGDVARDTQLNRQAQQLSAQGHYADAIPLLEQSVAIREKALGSDAPAVAQELNSLAQAYVDLGRYGEAEPLYRRTLAIAEKATGTESAAVALYTNNLAVLY